MDIQAFLNGLDTVEQHPPAYLFCPPKSASSREAVFEPYLASVAVECVVRRYVEASVKDLAFSSYYADEADPRQILSDARTCPFLSEKRVIAVQRADALLSAAPTELFLKYLADPAETTLLLLIAPEIDRRSKLYKACVAFDGVIECGQLNASQLGKQLSAWAGERGKTISAEAVEGLIYRAGKGLSELRNAMAIVCNYTGEVSAINLEDVAAACADTHEEEIWALTDAIASSDTEKALLVLREVLEPNKNEFQILGMVNWLLRNAYGVAAGGAAEGKVKPFVANKVRPLAQKFGKAKFGDAFRLCTDTDLLMRSTGVDRSLALEMLVIKLAAAPKKRVARSRLA